MEDPEHGQVQIMQRSRTCILVPQRNELNQDIRGSRAFKATGHDACSRGAARKRTGRALHGPASVTAGDGLVHAAGRLDDLGLADLGQAAILGNLPCTRHIPFTS